MAVDTQSKRRSVLGYGGPAAIIRPVPDGTIGASDRAQIVGLYSGYTYPLPVPGVSLYYTFIVPREERTFTVLAESRNIEVPREDRTFEVK